MHRNGLILPHSGPPCVLGRCVQAGVIQASRSPSAGRQLRPLPLSRSSPFVLHGPCRNPFNSTLVEEFGLWLLPCVSSCALYCVATGHPPAPSGSPLSGHSRVPPTNSTHTHNSMSGVCVGRGRGGVEGHFLLPFPTRGTLPLWVGTSGVGAVCVLVPKNTAPAPHLCLLCSGPSKSSVPSTSSNPVSQAVLHVWGSSLVVGFLPASSPCWHSLVHS